MKLSPSQSYVSEIQNFLSGSHLRDYLRYDEHGDLWINKLRVKDAVAKYGTPLEIHDMGIMKQRAVYWREKIREIAKDVEYTGDFALFYASKANMALSYVLNAYREGWLAETSSAQDLVHILQLHQKGLIGYGLPIICNGFKFPVLSQVSDQDNASTGITFVNDGQATVPLPYLYAEYIVKLFKLGFHIMPILDAGEVEYFAEQIDNGTMDVGLRMKFGIVHDDEHLARGVSRHGMSWDEISEVARVVDKAENLQLKMLHMMVSAAEVVPIDELVMSLLYGAEKYFELKKQYPSLQYLNVGGGIPPLASGYDYDVYLQRLLSGINRMAVEYGCEAPIVVFEFGSFLTDESGFLVHRVLQRKHNSVSDNEGDLRWAIVDGGLMAELPDMFITKKKFPVLAGNNGNETSSRYVLGDLTCDSDGRYPSKNAEEKFVVLPDADDQLVVFACVGAYQKMLGGAGGAHHCGLLNPGQLILEEEDGEILARYIPPQTEEEYAASLGYGELAHTSVQPRKAWWKFFVR